MAIELTVSTAQGRVPVTVLHLRGNLDASTYEAVIDEAQTAYRAGARDMLLDLSGVPYMSSSGLVALHSIASLLRGEQATDTSEGWAAFRAIQRDRDAGLQQHFKLFHPQPRVQQLLLTVGFHKYLETFEDLELAIAAF
jgi:anti-anti-sigma factor